MEKYVENHIKLRDIVYVLPIFEIEANMQLPNTKSELINLTKNSSVIVFHKNFCPACHTVPNFKEWLKSPGNKEGTFSLLKQFTI